MRPIVSGVRINNRELCHHRLYFNSAMCAGLTISFRDLIIPRFMTYPTNLNSRQKEGNDDVNTIARMVVIKDHSVHRVLYSPWYSCSLK